MTLIREILGIDEETDVTDDEMDILIEAITFYYDFFPTNYYPVSKGEKALKINELRKKLIKIKG